MRLRKDQESQNRSKVNHPPIRFPLLMVQPVVDASAWKVRLAAGRWNTVRSNPETFGTHGPLLHPTLEPVQFLVTASGPSPPPPSCRTGGLLHLKFYGSICMCISINYFLLSGLNLALEMWPMSTRKVSIEPQTKRSHCGTVDIESVCDKKKFF